MSKETIADRIRAHPRYAEYRELRQRREERGDSHQLRTAVRDVTQAIVDDLKAKRIKIASAQIAQAYKYEQDGLRPQGRPAAPDGKAGLRRRILDLQTAVSEAVRRLRHNEYTRRDVATLLTEALAESREEGT
jgi:hypothetical protein